MGILSADRGGITKKAQKVAQQIVSDFGVEDIETVIVDQISKQERSNLMGEIDPEYAELEKETRAIRDDLDKSLKNKQLNKKFNRYADLEYSRISNSGIAGFHLGFAAALHLLGRKS